MDQPAPSSPGSWTRDLVARSSDALASAPEASPARDYLAARGVDLPVALAHGVGVLAPIPCGTKPFLGWARRNWPVWGGLVFPLRDPLGGVVGLQVRRLPSQVEPGQSAYVDYQFSNAHPRAFGIPEALPAIWDSRRIVLVEGVFDYFAVRAAGAPDCVANLTAHVASPMRRFLGRYARLVVALLDMDPVGREAAAKLREIGTREGFTVTAPAYRGKDAGSLLQVGQLAGLAQVLGTHRVVLHFPPG